MNMAAFKSLQQTTFDSEHIVSGNIILGHKNSKRRLAKIMVLVEGKDDLPVYSTFLDVEKVDFRDCFGSDKVWNERKSLKKHQPNTPFITILDSDFRRLNDSLKHPDDVFYTDHHDSEMLMFTSDSLMKSLFFDLTREKNYVDLKSRIDHELYIISMLKWYNMKYHFKYEFDRSDLSTVCWNKQIDIDTSLKYLQPSPLSKKVLKKSSFIDFLTNYVGQDINQLMNGHDFIGRLAAIYRKDYKKQYSAEKFRELVCNYFTLKIAKKTQLYKDIQKWAGIYQMDILVDR